MIMNDSCCCWLVNDGLLSRMNWRKRSNYCDKSPEVGFVFTLKNKLAQDILRSFSLFVQILCNLLEESNRSKTGAHPGYHLDDLSCVTVAYCRSLMTSRPWDFLFVPQGAQYQTVQDLYTGTFGWPFQSSQLFPFLVP